MKNQCPSVSFSEGILGAGILGCLLAGCNFSFNIVDGYSFDYSGQKREKKESADFSPGIREITVENRFGDLAVVSAADGEAGWAWDASCWASTDDMAQTYLNALVLEVETSGDSQSLKLVLPEQKSDLKGVRSNLTVRVPAGLQINLVNAHGNLVIADVDANLTAENSHGNASLQGLTGKSVVSLSHGNATVEHVADLALTVNHGIATVDTVTGRLSFEGSHGNFEARHVDGVLTVRASHMAIEAMDVSKSAELATSHNSIFVSQLRGGGVIKNSHGRIVVSETAGNLEVTNQHGATRIAAASDIISVASQHGRVEIEMLEPRFQTIRAETTHADLIVSVPESTVVNLDMITSHGKESSDLQSDPTSSSKVLLKTSFGDIRVLKQSASKNISSRK